ncbi:putative membrane protein DUF2318 [Geothermobacter ehrlichii]|uniref:Putative membrane protein DUF2318 n=1 Tax=Geothermobacter ehrlichii TaxID=213224 RepID=A0A5D3WJ84_9BACT|nr:DUF2318 domain-containing protein [Geothermobacter ehrlichii]TYO98258.1 putative membrane protein DUF2318 [Geothermobacter ehrlichii]
MSERQAKRDQFRKEGEGAKSTGRLLLPGILVLLAALGVGAWLLLGDGGGGGVQTVRIDEGGVLHLPASDFDDGRARFFQYRGQHGTVRFFVVKSRDGVIRAAFDACDVCYREKKGYRQEGDAMICNNCGQAFPSDQVNVVKGGCNPSPLQRELVGDQVRIRVASLEQGVKYF